MDLAFEDGGSGPCVVLVRRIRGPTRPSSPRSSLIFSTRRCLSSTVLGTCQISRQRRAWPPRCWISCGATRHAA